MPACFSSPKVCRLTVPDGPRAPIGLRPADAVRRSMARVSSRDSSAASLSVATFSSLQPRTPDLVPLALGDLRHHLRVDEIGDASDEERRRHVVPVEQLEHARQPLRGAEFAAGHRDDGRVAARELVGRVADVEGQGHGDARAVRPGLRS